MLGRKRVAVDTWDEVPNKALSCNVCPRAGGKSVGIIIPPGFQVTRNG